MNAVQALSIQLAALVAVHGIQRVQRVLASIDDERVARVDELGIDKGEREAPPADAKRRRRKKSVEELIREANVDLSIRPLVEEIGSAYEQGVFLPDLWRVRKFLESEGVEATKLRSRNAALRKVIDVLARQPHDRLQELLVESKSGRGELAIITDQILGSPAGGAKAAEPGTLGSSVSSPARHRLRRRPVR